MWSQQARSSSCILVQILLLCETRTCFAADCFWADLLVSRKTSSRLQWLSKLSVLVESRCQEQLASLTRVCRFALPGLVSSRMCSLTLMVLLVPFITQVYDQKFQRKTKLCSSNYGVSKIFAGKQQKSAVRAEISGKQGKCNHCVRHGDSVQTYTENCVSTV